MTLKKRIIGFLLLLGIILIAIPLFFGRSVNSDELNLSGRTPASPPKPEDIAMAIPPEAETMPEIILSSEQSAIPNPDSTEPPTPFDTNKFPVPVKAPAVVSQIKVDNTPKDMSPLIPLAPPVLAAHVTSDAPQAIAPAPTNVSTSVATTVSTVQPSTHSDTQIHKAISQSPALNSNKSKATASTSLASSTDSQQVSSVAKSSLVAANNLSPPQQKKVEKPAKPVPTPAVSTAMKSPAKAPPLLPSGNTAWVVQLGSFTDRHNVEKLTQKLQAKGYTVYTEPGQTKSGISLTKVMIGPNIRREDADQLRVNVQKEFGLQGAILVKVKT